MPLPVTVDVLSGGHGSIMTSFSGALLPQKLHHILHTEEKTLISCLSVCVQAPVFLFRTPRAIKVSSQLVLLGSHTEVVKTEFCSSTHSVCCQPAEQQARQKDRGLYELSVWMRTKMNWEVQHYSMWVQRFWVAKFNFWKCLVQVKM